LSDRVVLIGACGWQHPQWDETYYPEGLPQEWQLAYYANEYPVVLVPAGYWAQGQSVVDSWLAETEGRPDFICEWSFDGGQEQQAMIASLGERVLGILVRLTAMPDANQWQMLATLAQSYSLCLDWPDAELTQVQDIMQHDCAKAMSVCWHGEQDHADALSYGDLVLARVPSAGQTPRNLRDLLETLLQHAGERQAVLLFDGHPPDLEVVDQAEVVLNLLY